MENMPTLLWDAFWLPSILFLLYFLVTWVITGRYYRRKPSYPNHDAPTDISPAVARYLLKGKIDNISFVAQLVNLHLKGVIKIASFNGGTRILKNTSNNDEELLKDEKIVFDELFKVFDEPIHLSYKRDVRMSNAKIVNRKSVKEYCFNSKYLKRKWPFIVLTVLVSIIYLLYVGVTLFPESTYEEVWPSFFTIPFVVILAFPCCVFTPGVFRIFSIFFFGLFFIFLYFTPMPYKNTLLISLVVPIIVYLYSMHIKVFTAKGAQKRAEIKGLKLYLKVAENERFKFYNSLENKINIFEKYLSYAIAFDLKNQWVKVFENIITNMSFDTSQILRKTTTLRRVVKTTSKK